MTSDTPWPEENPSPEAALAAMSPDEDATTLDPAGGVALDAGGRLAEDRNCSACGYNLRGADPQGTCPECGTAVGFSLVGDLLKFADPIWVRRLANGSAWLIASVIATVVVVVITIAASAAAISQGDSGEFIIQLALIMMVLPITFSLFGYWETTAPEPVEFDHPRPLRVWARWLSVVSSVFGAGFILALVLLMDTISYSFMAVAELASLPLGVAATVTFMLWARSLALRLPDQKLADQTRFVMWGLVIHEVVDLVSEAVEFVSCMAAVLGLTFGVWSIVLMVQYRTRLRSAAVMAERSWARYAGHAEHPGTRRNPH